MSQQQKTIEQVQSIVDKVRFGDEWFVLHHKGDGFLLQLQYHEADIDDPSKVEVQHARAESANSLQ